jgi:hypothetical protein
MDLLAQQMLDREEQALLARLREACPDADEEEGRGLIQSAVDMAVKDGLRGAAALTWAMSMIQRALDEDLLKTNMDVRD